MNLKYLQNGNRPYPAWELLIPILAACSLLVSCYVLSGKKYFWNDELYSYYFLSDPSFQHMWGSFHDKINNTPPLYFLLGWLWDKLFGSSELSLRLFSSLGMGTACVITWITLRRTYSFVGASLGTLFPFCGSVLVLYQNSEARMYGLYLTICALALLLYDTLNRTEKPGRRLLIANALVYVALIQTHLHGLFFSGAALVAFIVTDWYFKWFRPRVYLTVVAGWLSFLLYLPSFLIQADAGKPRTWIYLPNWRDLVDTLTLFEYATRQWGASLPITYMTWLKLLIIIFLSVLSVWHFLALLKQRPRSVQKSMGYRRKKDRMISLFFFAYAFLAVPLFAWGISYIIRPVFSDRYLMPLLFGWAIILAHSFTYFTRLVHLSDFPDRAGFSRSRLSRIGYVVVVCLVGFLLLNPLRYAKARRRELLPSKIGTLYGYKELPVVLGFSNEFLRRLHYSPDRNRYYYILDWPSAIHSTSGLFPPQEYKHLEALNRRYPDYFRNQVVQSKEFLRNNKRFLVLTHANYTRECSEEPTVENVQCPRWFPMVILPDPAYKVTTLGNISTYYKLHLVEAR